MIRRFIFLLACIVVFMPGYPCTSMLVSPAASQSRRPMMWKHRDTGAADNFLAKVPAKGADYAYVALFNGGDSLLREAWMGMNEAGFAIMNTASYNLAPDTAKYKDKEGEVMSAALARCCTLADFEALLADYPKPMGIQANFGVMDAEGGLAYYEADDYYWLRFDVSDSENGVLVRTNYSLSGEPKKGHGYVRYDNACQILKDDIANNCLSPISFTEKASRSFWHSQKGIDYEQNGQRWTIDQDFIPRYISTASIVIVGVNPDEDCREIAMWAALGYPPCAVAQKVTIDDIPAELGPNIDGWHSSACLQANALKNNAFRPNKGKRPNKIDMDYLRAIIPVKREESLKNYKSFFSSSSFFDKTN